MSVFDQFNLKNRRALITGSSRGLGLAMARALSQAGAEVVITGSDAKRLEAAVAELRAEGLVVEGIQADLSTPEAAETFCEEALRRFPVIDILVNNIGGRRINKPTEELPLADWQRLIDLNLNQAFVCTQRLGAAMLPRGWGRIINITSIHAHWPGKAMRGRSYETAKAGLTMFSKAVAADWAACGVTVNCIAPGPFMTEANERWVRERPEFEQEIASSIPMGRWGKPEEMGGLIVYLASDASCFMTGSELVLDGGKLLW